MTTEPASGVAWLDQLSREIRRCLRAQRSTQQALAAHVGITPKHMSQVLTGKIAAKPELLERLAAAVGLRIVIAVGDREPVPLALDTRGRRIRRPEPDKRECLICQYDQHPDDLGRQAVIDALAPQAEDETP